MIMGISSNGYRFWDVSAETMGALNISGGTVAVPGIQCGLISTNNTITMTNGTLLVSGTIGPGLANFVMADSSLQLQASATPSAVVTNLSTGGASNLLNIGSVVGLNSFPTQVTLIKYSGSIGGAGFNFGLGALPSTGYSGYLSNNAANSSVDLVLSALLLAGRLTNGNFQLTINGQPNRVVDILTSTNLSDWTWFITVTNSSGTSVFIDPAAISAQRFYRAQQVP